MAGDGRDRSRAKIVGMEQLHAVVGPLSTNVYVLADQRSREAIAIDTAIPCLEWISDALAEREWTLKLIVSTHGHWDHTGANAAVQAHTGAPIAVHPDDAYRLITPSPLYAPFEIPPCVPAVDLAEGGEIRFGEVRLRVLHTPGHTEGSVCLLSSDDRRAVQRRHAVPRRLGPGRFPRRRRGCHGDVDRPAVHARGPVARAARSRRADDDRPRATVDGAGARHGPAADLSIAVPRCAYRAGAAPPPTSPAGSTSPPAPPSRGSSSGPAHRARRDRQERPAVRGVRPAPGA